MPIRAKLSREITERRLLAIAPNANVAVAAAVEKGAKELAAAIQDRAPVKTGRYKDSIRAVPLAGFNGNKNSVVGIQLTKSQFAWIIVADFIWRFLEFGTQESTYGETVVNKKGRKRIAKRTHKGTKPYPHIFNTYAEKRKSIYNRIARAVNSSLKAGG